jgi:hypothetical protein
MEDFTDKYGICHCSRKGKSFVNKEGKEVDWFITVLRKRI